jgi:Fic family protein
MQSARDGQKRLFAALGKVDAPTVGDRYHHWHTLRHRAPPEGLTHEEWWFALKLRRKSSTRLPLLDTAGHPFHLVMVDPLWQMLHELDSNAGARVTLPGPVATPANRERYLATSLMEEAITSSLLEGAATTRQVAKELLRSGRKPRDVSERMVLNNYRTMQWIREQSASPLTPKFVLDVHRRMTEGTLDDPSGVGRFRRSDETIVVGAIGSDEIVHTPPPAKGLERRLEALAKFANESVHAPFMHPAVRAIVLHFWLAYDHPFVDGNGRTARALFYWSMLRQGYWMFEFLPISRLFLAAPGKYARAFQYTETDDNDLTYFTLYHVRICLRAIDDLHVYMATKSREQEALGRMLKTSVDLNTRQIALLTHALDHADAEYTIEAHRGSHGVVYQTARTDLLDLVERGLFERRRVGRTLVFVPKSGLEQRLRRLT